MQSQTYGTSTANGVPTYKCKRGIINRAYQTQSDSIVSKMTIAALDAEMARVGPKPQGLNCFPSRLYSSNRFLRFAKTDVITIGKDFANSNTNMRAAVLIHEGGHFADASCLHAASELPAPDGSPIDDVFGKATNPAQKNYAQLDLDLSIRNAYSVAQCAMHNGLGIDKRPP